MAVLQSSEFTLVREANGSAQEAQSVPPVSRTCFPPPVGAARPTPSRNARTSRSVEGPNVERKAQKCSGESRRRFEGRTWQFSARSTNPQPVKWSKPLEDAGEVQKLQNYKVARRKSGHSRGKVQKSAVPKVEGAALLRG